MSHFYITLPSNSSQIFFPDNTLTRYKTKLHNDMALKGDWEAGLSEVLFVKSWNNVISYGDDKNYSNIRFSCDDCQYPIPGITKGVKFSYVVNVKVDVGYYDTPVTLVTHIVEAIEKVFGIPFNPPGGGGTVLMPREAWPAITHYSSMARVHVALCKRQCMEASPQLYKMLGFTEEQSKQFLNFTEKRLI